MKGPDFSAWEPVKKKEFFAKNQRQEIENIQHNEKNPANQELAKRNGWQDRIPQLKWDEQETGSLTRWLEEVQMINKV